MINSKADRNFLLGWSVTGLMVSLLLLMIGLKDGEGIVTVCGAVSSSAAFLMGVKAYLWLEIVFGVELKTFGVPDNARRWGVVTFWRSLLRAN